MDTGRRMVGLLLVGNLPVGWGGGGGVGIGSVQVSVKGIRRQRIGIRDRRRGDAAAWQARLPSYPRRPLIRRNNLDKRRGAVAHMPVRVAEEDNKNQKSETSKRDPLPRACLDSDSEPGTSYHPRSRWRNGVFCKTVS